eukprot:scaffold14143_cov129-Isochrysis_galbana.AAC.5
MLSSMRASLGDARGWLDPSAPAGASPPSPAAFDLGPLTPSPVCLSRTRRVARRRPSSSSPPYRVSGREEYTSTSCSSLCPARLSPLPAPAAAGVRVPGGRDGGAGGHGARSSS